MSMVSDRRSGRGVGLLCLALLLLAGAMAWGGYAAAEPMVGDAHPTSAHGMAAQSRSHATQLLPPEDRYGLWTLLPAGVAIATAILLRQVLPALTLGIFTASYMVMLCLPPEQKFGAEDSVITALRLSVEHYFVGVFAHADKIKTVLFTLTIAGMVGIIHANGGTAAFVRQVGKWASTRRKGQLSTYVAGLCLFFDDYSNCMIIGPTMRPVLDRLRVSREKLAFLVDATAAPVASLALFGTWIGAEVGFIQSGLDQLKGDDRLPAFLEGVTAYQTFIWSLPYRFYAIFALMLVFLIGLSGRDFGPMRKAEQRVQIHPVDEESPPDMAAQGRGHATPFSHDNDAGRWWYAGVPVLMLIVVTVSLLFITGLAADPPPEGFGEILSQADPYVAILYGALSAVTAALVVSLVTRALTLRATLDGFMVGMQRIYPAVVVLILAWALSEAMKDLHLAEVAVRRLQAHAFSPHLLPLLLFISACVVSFATGTSWGTMGILCPVAVMLAGQLAADLPRGEALPLFYAATGSVLVGAVFGDHCSPISDTTVLSALASGCSLEAHVWTQLPYALTAAAVEIVAGDLLCARFGAPVWVGWIVGAAALVMMVWGVGRPVTVNGGAKPRRS
jgi:Na+/H+ antiporter NhaC